MEFFIIRPVPCLTKKGSCMAQWQNVGTVTWRSHFWASLDPFDFFFKLEYPLVRHFRALAWYWRNPEKWFYTCELLPCYDWNNFESGIQHHLLNQSVLQEKRNAQEPCIWTCHYNLEHFLVTKYGWNSGKGLKCPNNWNCIPEYSAVQVMFSEILSPRFQET